MSKVPSLNYPRVIHALQRAGFTIIRQRGSHIRLQRKVGDDMVRIIVPAHLPIKRSTLSHILKYAGLTLEEFLEFL